MVWTRSGIDSIHLDAMLADLLRDGEDRIGASAMRR